MMMIVEILLLLHKAKLLAHSQENEWRGAKADSQPYDNTNGLSINKASSVRQKIGEVLVA